MSSILVINTTSHETRVALVKNGALCELHIERGQDQGLVGNIYKGRVLRVLPGMQAAFVDIGEARAGFLYVADVHTIHLDPAVDTMPAAAPRGRARGNIQDLLEEGQTIIVQVSKEPIGSKGARLTGHISIPGRYLVYMPTTDHIGISRRIESEEERDRLRAIVEENRPAGSGFIVRTACQGVDHQLLADDLTMLVKLWGDVLGRRTGRKTPSELYSEHDVVLRATRDLFSAELEKIVLDDDQDYERVVEFAATYVPSAVGRIDRYTGSEPIFDAYGIEIELERALARKVWLNSGGYIVIDHTEAMTCIDVNTGRYVGKNTLEDTIVKINIEAAEEIVYQLQLRGIGGLIIIDFIDMEKPTNRERVYQALTQALEGDKSRTNVLNISEFGLVEMTRKRVRESMVQYLCDECPYCEGKGYVKSAETVAYEIIRDIVREGGLHDEPTLAVRLHPAVASVLQEEERDAIKNLETGFGKRLRLVPDGSFHLETYEFEPEG